jgi:transcription initiation factor IIF auxiliary subunit
MSYRIAQSYEYKGEDWWEWCVWLEGAREDLDNVAYVQYTLHRTFPKPVRRVEDPAHNFRLCSSGWGTFPFHVLVVTKDGTEIRLTHELELHYPDGEGAPQ